jgi:hypothetical protein
MAKPYIPDQVTIGEKYGPAMAITEPEAAREYFEACVEQHQRRKPGTTREEAERIERQNLGYYAGYYNVHTQERVDRLFGAAHPVFGSTGGGDSRG